MQLSQESQEILTELVEQGETEAIQLQQGIEKHKIKSIAPCHNKSRWGCYVMLHQLGLAYGPIYFVGVDPATHVKIIEFVG